MTQRGWGWGSQKLLVLIAIYLVVQIDNRQESSKGLQTTNVLPRGHGSTQDEAELKISDMCEVKQALLRGWF